MMYIAFFGRGIYRPFPSLPSLGLASRAVVGVIIVQADDSHHVTDGSVPYLTTAGRPKNMGHG